jgi:hypothetical protein
MKKIAILSIVFAGLAFAACKKDKACECTETTTYATSAGTTTVTDPVRNIEIKEIKGGEAKSWCQKSTEVTVSGPNTTTRVDDCKLK